MLSGGTYIKLYRSLVNWRWYKNGNTVRLFIHLIIKANISDSEFENITIKRGQVVTSRKQLASELNLSEQNIRTALKNLKSTNDITIETTSKYSIVTIVKYDYYQSSTNTLTNNQPTTNQQLTNNQPTTNQQLTNNQPHNKNKEEKKNNKKRERETLAPLGRFKNVFLSQNEIDELKAKYPKHYEAKIERLSRYIESTDKQYNNHFATLLEWLEQDTTNEQRESRNTSYDIDELETVNTLDKYTKGVDYF